MYMYLKYNLKNTPCKYFVSLPNNVLFLEYLSSDLNY